METVLQRPLSYVNRLEKRNVGNINLAVIHCTELPDLDTARQWGERLVHENSRTGNSGHFYIDRDGIIEQWVPVDRVAHHARGQNVHTIGIELVNSGRFPNWFHSAHQHMSEPYPDQQIEALVYLLNDLAARYPSLGLVTGHEDLDTELLPADDSPATQIRRKLDPGPLFPWSLLLSRITLRRLLTEEP
jgi:N-acetylmuramoyl-L-alanine amidase